MNKKLLYFTLLFVPLATLCFEAQAMQKYYHLRAQTNKRTLFTSSNPLLSQKNPTFYKINELEKDFANLTLNEPLCENLEFSVKNKIYQLIKTEIPEQESQSKKTNHLKFVYNDPELFKNTWELENVAFKRTGQDAWTKEKWIKDHENLIKSLEKNDLKFYFHAIVDDNNTIISCRYGKFKSEWFCHTTLTHPLFAHKDLAWQIMLSIFDRYPMEKSIQGIAISQAGEKFYLKHGFVKIGETLEVEKYLADGKMYPVYELTRENAEKLVKEKKARKKEKLSEI
ncbi:MAG: hypothetical protein ABH827_00270 [bacterium]